MKTYLQFLLVFLCIKGSLSAQTIIAFQGFEGTASDNWSYTGPTQNTASGQVIVGAGNYGAGYAKTGSNSMRAGGGSTGCGSGSANCINGASSGASCNNASNGKVVTFNAINVSCLTAATGNVVLSVSHRCHVLCASQGQGFDAGETLLFQVSLNGGAYTTVGTITGSGNYGWLYTTSPAGVSTTVPNPFTYNVPAGTTSVAFQTVSNTDRADEVYYLDDVKLTTTTTGYAFPGTAGLWGGYVNTDWFNACNWNDRTIPTATTNVVFPSNNTGNKDIVINTGTNPTCNNLTINGSGSKQIKGEGSATKKLTINGNLTIASTDGLDFSDGTSGTADGTIEIYGNWINNGVESDFKEGNSTVKFMGTANQTISTAEPAGEEAFYALDINKSSGIVTMNDDVWIDKDIEGGASPLLTFTQGKLDLNGKVLKIWNPNEQAVTRTAGGIISEKTNNSSKVTWAIENNTGTHVFPFMNATNYYIPFTFNLTAGDVNDLTVSTYPTAGNNLPYPSSPQTVTNVNGADGNDNSLNTVNRFWQIDKTGPSGTADITFTYGDNEWDSAEPFDYEAQRWDTPTALWQAAISGQTQNVGVNAVTVPGVSTFSPWTLASKIHPLPIELINFSANYNERKQVDLKWTTLTEKNNDFFTIERSNDAISFEEINRIDGAGNSLQRLNYFSVDEQPKAGLSYYRLKQTDFDKTYSYSQIETIFVGIEEEDLRIFPNPTETGKLKISTENDILNEIRLVDALGQLMYRSDCKGSLMELNLENFGKGIYFIWVFTDKKIVTKKVIYN